MVRRASFLLWQLFKMLHQNWHEVVLVELLLQQPRKGAAVQAAALLCGVIGISHSQ